MAKIVNILLPFTGHLGSTDILVKRRRELAVVSFENEALPKPALSSKFGVQGISDRAFPVKLNDPVVKDDAFVLGPLAEAATALIIHEGVFNHLQRGIFDKT